MNLDNTENKIEVLANNVHFSYTTYVDGVNEEKKKAVDGMSLSLQKGSYTAILGPNGSGKSNIVDAIK